MKRNKVDNSKKYNLEDKNLYLENSKQIIEKSCNIEINTITIIRR